MQNMHNEDKKRKSEGRIFELSTYFYDFAVSAFA